MLSSKVYAQLAEDLDALGVSSEFTVTGDGAVVMPVATLARLISVANKSVAEAEERGFQEMAEQRNLDEMQHMPEDPEI